MYICVFLSSCICIYNVCIHMRAFILRITVRVKNVYYILDYMYT